MVGRQPSGQAAHSLDNNDLVDTENESIQDGGFGFLRTEG